MESRFYEGDVWNGKFAKRIVSSLIFTIFSLVGEGEELRGGRLWRAAKNIIYRTATARCWAAAHVHPLGYARDPRAVDLGTKNREPRTDRKNRG